MADRRIEDLALAFFIAHEQGAGDESPEASHRQFWFTEMTTEMKAPFYEMARAQAPAVPVPESDGRKRMIHALANGYTLVSLTSGEIESLADAALTASPVSEESGEADRQAELNAAVEIVEAHDLRVTGERPRITRCEANAGGGMSMAQAEAIAGTIDQPEVVLCTDRRCRECHAALASPVSVSESDDGEARIIECTLSDVREGDDVLLTVGGTWRRVAEITRSTDGGPAWTCLADEHGEQLVLEGDESRRIVRRPVSPGEGERGDAWSDGYRRGRRDADEQAQRLADHRAAPAASGEGDARAALTKLREMVASMRFEAEAEDEQDEGGHVARLGWLLDQIDQLAPASAVEADQAEKGQRQATCTAECHDVLVIAREPEWLRCALPAGHDGDHETGGERPTRFTEGARGFRFRSSTNDAQEGENHA